jgi:predicted nucleotidyltransferase
MDLKHIDFKDSSFTANGTEYFIKNTLTVERFMHFEKLQVHVGFGKDFKAIFKDLDMAITLADKGKGVEAWSIILNMRNGVAQKLEDRMHPALLLCTLFVITKDEDITQWDEELGKRKIDDWRKEPFDMNDFFRLAANLVTGFIPILNELTQDISKKLKKASSLMSNI